MDWITLTREEIEADALPPVCMECGTDGPVRVNRTFRHTSPLFVPLVDLGALLVGLLPAALFGLSSHRIFTRHVRISCPFCERHAEHWDRPWASALKVGAAAGLIVGLIAWAMAFYGGAGAGERELLAVGAAAVAGLLTGTLTALISGSQVIEATELTARGVTLQHVSPRFVEAMQRVREAGPPTDLSPPGRVAELSRRGAKRLGTAAAAASTAAVGKTAAATGSLAARLVGRVLRRGK